MMKGILLMMTKKWLMMLGVAACLGAAFLVCPRPAAAEQMTESGNILRLSPDATQVIKLDRDAASVIVTNPNNVRVLLDTPRLLLVMPRAPGSTSFMVMDANGEKILEKTVIVDALAKPKYVRIRRMCGQAGSGADCVPTSYFYCPDGCYEVSTVNPANDGGEVPAQGGGASGNGTTAFQGAQPGDLAGPPQTDNAVPPAPAPTPPPAPVLPVPQ